MTVLEWKCISAILAGLLIWSLFVNYRRHPKSSFDGIDDNEQARLSQEIIKNFGRCIEKYNVYIPISALQHSVEDVKRAYRILSVHRECNEEHRALLRRTFSCLGNVFSDDDAVLMRMRIDLSVAEISELSSQQRDRYHFLLQRSSIKENMLDYEWDIWMLENNIKQLYSSDDIKRQADALNLTIDDLRDLEPGYVPSQEELVTNRKERLKSGKSCREQILSCVGQILQRNESNEFTLQEVIEQMQANGSSYKESTIRTHVASRMCASSPDHHGTTFDDFERVGQWHLPLDEQVRKITTKAAFSASRTY